MDDPRCSFARGLAGKIVQFGTAYPKTATFIPICLSRSVLWFGPLSLHPVRGGGCEFVSQ
ncbi:hypothetical protein SISSUDRAFT_1055292 [Sistotremastrum suecicum HHB10207 ss-3]|uniref:Uncharacterized protein n=1 Tax=Sistotremastrum suecicum HHB10207 ss-3 TaxID=1314776 RepID=A0A165XWT3_9AGAM|nr:hypothetical protein SISSUDRAFT_1055292 [Sistotremastrum suecicum HHB10207 ss-3]